MLRVTSLLCLLPALALATPPVPAHAPRALPTLAPGALRLQLPERREWSHLAYSAQEGRNGVRTGVLAGVLMGGMLGAGAGTALCTGLETDGRSAPPRPLTCGFFGGLIGAVLGAGTGAMLAWAASPERRERAGSTDESGRAPGGLQDEGDALEFGLQLGWMLQAGSGVSSLPTPVGQPPQRAELPTLHGPGANLRLLARLGPSVALGPELAAHELLTQEFIDPVSGLSVSSGGTLYILGLQARVGASRGQLRPELVLGFGRFLGDTGVFAGSAGAALSYAVSPRFLPQLEVRYHRSFEGDADYVTLGAGAALRW